jgi:phosphatidylglycerophosphate synthase
MTKKLPNEFDNPCDNIILYPFQIIDESLYNLKITPNHLTTLSALFGFLSIYAVYQSNFLYAGVYYFLYYAFDCYDGYFARKYHMETEFGDKYDHYKDMIFNIVMATFILLHPNITITNKILLVIGVLFLGFIGMQHFGCQEKYYNKPTYTTEPLMKYCIGNPEKTLREYRYYTSTTLVLFIVFFFIIISFEK